MIEKDMSNINEYNLRRYRQKKQRYRIKLGIQEFLHKPALNLIWVVLIIVFVIANNFVREFITKQKIPQILIPVYKYLPVIVLITVFLVLVFAILMGIAEENAKDDEADIIEAFRDYRGDKLPPILVFKKKLKNSRCIRQFYSFFTVEEWMSKKSEIETCLNVQVIGEIENEKNRRIVTIKSYDGKASKRKEVLYDDEF